MLRCGCKDVPNVGALGIAWPDCVGSVGQGDSAVTVEIDYRFCLGTKTVHVPRLVVHGVCGKSDAGKPERSHLRLEYPKPLGLSTIG